MARSLVLINGTVVSCRSGAGAEAGTVVIEGSTIRCVGGANEVEIPEGSKVYDVEGKTIVPGLIDGHMHVSKEPGRLDHWGHLRTNLEAVGVLQACLRAGTTTVAHAAGSAESVLLRDVIASGKIEGCADLVVGGVITATCGHVRGVSADGPWEIRKAVREMIAGGADHIKTCASGGFQWEHEKLEHEDYTPEELQVLADQAHSREKRVHVHAHAHPGLGNAIEAGCDVILHGVLMDEAGLEAMATKDLWYMPTLHITSERIWSGDRLPSYMTERMKAAHPIHRAGVAKAYKMGIKLAAGTDGGPGSIVNEMRELIDCGLTPMDAIMVATRHTADALGILDKTGTIEAGKQANLLIVNGDPTEDINVLEQGIDMVIKNGDIQTKKI